MDSSTRSHRTLSVSTTPAAAGADLPSPPPRQRSLGKKSSQAQLRGLFGRLRNKSSLDFGCSGQVDDEDFAPAPKPAPAMSWQGSAGAGSFRSAPEDGRGRARRESNAGSATNSVSSS